MALHICTGDGQCRTGSCVVRNQPTGRCPSPAADQPRKGCQPLPLPHPPSWPFLKSRVCLAVVSAPGCYPRAADQDRTTPPGWLAKQAVADLRQGQACQRVSQGTAQEQDEQIQPGSSRVASMMHVLPVRLLQPSLRTDREVQSVAQLLGSVPVAQPRMSVQGAAKPFCRQDTARTRLLHHFTGLVDKSCCESGLAGC